VAYTILVVDDSNTIRAMLERTLRMTKLPIEVVIQAADGAEALVHLKEKWIDIVFTDIHMPNVDGLMLVEQMQAHQELKEIPVIVISTEGSSTRVEELKKKGVKGYLRKPFTPERVRDTILETLGGWDV
jgi:two-component system chemotaxis response regulator CheY